MTISAITLLEQLSLVSAVKYITLGKQQYSSSNTHRDIHTYTCWAVWWCSPACWSPPCEPWATGEGDVMELMLAGHHTGTQRALCLQSWIVQLQQTAALQLKTSFIKCQLCSNVRAENSSVKKKGKLNSRNTAYIYIYECCTIIIGSATKTLFFSVLFMLIYHNYMDKLFPSG